MLSGLFWFAAVFGVGVTVIDLLGLLGGGSAGDSGDSGDSGGAAGAGDTAVGGLNGSSDSTGSTGSSDSSGTGDHGAGAPVLSFLRVARILVYFCLGFGPLGLAATAFGSGTAGSLAWALAGGVSSATLAHLFFRFQRTKLDSSVQDEELLMEPATVIVPIADGGMGKVRVHFGQTVAERYARAEHPDERFALDDCVIISQVTEPCVYVRKEDS